MIKHRAAAALAATAAFAAACAGAAAQARAPSKPSAAPLSFLVVGDWGRDGKGFQTAVATQMGKTAAKLHATFVISTGDNFYSDGVKNVSDPQFKSSFENVYTARSLMVPWYVALGNHDYHGDPQVQVDYSKVSTRWHMPARYFSFTYTVDDSTRAEFFIIDTSPFQEKYRTDKKMAAQLANVSTAPQLAWLDSALAASKAQWKIVAGHHTIYSASPVHGNTMELIRDVVPLLEKYHVQAYLNGHDHDLQHARAGSVSYLTSGGGSQARPTGHDAHTLFSRASPGFLAAVLSAGSLRIQFIDDSGRVLYTAAIPRTPSVAASVPR